MKIRVGDTLKNNEPYEGEGELIVAKTRDDYFEAIHACHVKYKDLNGMVEHFSYDKLSCFHKIK